MTATFKTSATLSALNQGSLSHPKMHVVNDDAAKWLEASSEKFDVIIIDLPDPSNFSLGKLYSVPMYRLVARHLEPQGKIVVQSTSPYFAPQRLLVGRCHPRSGQVEYRALSRLRPFLWRMGDLCWQGLTKISPSRKNSTYPPAISMPRPSPKCSVFRPIWQGARWKQII